LTFRLPGPFRWRLLVESAKPESSARDIPGDSYVLEGYAAALIVTQLDGPA
jgi:hypothetical protein